MREGGGRGGRGGKEVRGATRLALGGWMGAQLWRSSVHVM